MIETRTSMTSGFGSKLHTGVIAARGRSTRMCAGSTCKQDYVARSSCMKEKDVVGRLEDLNGRVRRCG